MTKIEVENRLNAIANANNAKDNGFTQTVVARDWENYGKSRTYYSIVETRTGSKHYKKRDYGFYDNQTNSFSDENALNYTVGGMVFAG